MRCTKCSAANREGRGFCAECGAPLTTRCNACGFLNEPGAKFWGGCGVPVTLPEHEPAEERATTVHTVSRAERRQLTIIFCDLVGSTEMTTRLDPEEAGQVLAAYQDCCARVVERCCCDRESNRN